MSKEGNLYSSPFRVYLCLGLLALIGVFSGLSLPISLFPNSTKPEITVNIPYGNLTPEEFLNSYGKELEYLFKQSTGSSGQVDGVEAHYQRREVDYSVSFTWGADPKTSLSEILNRANSFAARLPQESRDGLHVWLHDENSGFFAASFYSKKRSLDSLHELLDPILMPKVSSLIEANEPTLYNPTRKEIRIELIPEVMASLKLLPSDIDRALAQVLKSFTGGTVTTPTRSYFVEMPRIPLKVEDLGQIPIKTGSGKWVHLSDISRIDMGLKTGDSRSFKTSGAQSLILFSRPRPGGNVKKMSEDIVAAINETMPSLPKDIEYKVLVDPSLFIQSSINNVFHEVGLAALLAVLVLFLFIGSIKNVITAAIEIPLSMVLAFILMRLFGINLNLISLGGLALSAGMNVDASVVVMENIFRKRAEKNGVLSFKEKLDLVVSAVSEVRFAVVASTIASLVVFIPLVFTRGLSYSILGDLAMAVVFSHGFSALIALILVPTIRLALMDNDEKESKSPVEPWISKLENTYSFLLSRFLDSAKYKAWAFCLVFLTLVSVLFFFLPRLPKEIVATPDTDWIFLNIRGQGNTHIRQMETLTEEVEGEVLKEFQTKIQYTFTQVNGLNNATIMSRLFKKSDMKLVWEGLEKRFANTPLTKFRVGPWNPSELPIPDPPHFRIIVNAPLPETRTELSKELSDFLQEKQLYPRVWTQPNAEADQAIQLIPYIDQWEALSRESVILYPSDMADLVRVATTGRQAGMFPLKKQLIPVMLGFPRKYIESPDDIASIPIGIGDRMVPLKALAKVQMNRGISTLYRHNDRDLNVVEAKLDHHDEKEAPSVAKKTTVLLEEWKKKNQEKLMQTNASFTIEDPNIEFNEAISELKKAVFLSVALIFFVLMLQFTSVMESLIVLVAIPLGVIGVMLSLFIFQSTLSLNSILGVILLNGISVANSILLVDFTKKLFASGMSPKEAALQASKLRLRPILITSLTTILGMLPIAFGMGEGGRILQPLGIAVSGGLWVSMLLTLFLVPSLHVSLLTYFSKGSDSEFQFRYFEKLVEFFKISKLKLRVGALRKISKQGSAFLRHQCVFLLLFLSPVVWAEVKPLPILQAIKTIVERHTDVAKTKASFEAMRVGNVPYRLVFLPTVGVEGFRSEARDVGMGSGVGSAGDVRHGVEANAKINLFKFGSDWAQIKSANYQEEALEQAVWATVIRAEDEGMRSVVSFIQGTFEVSILSDLSRALLKSLEVARERYHQGLLPNQEVDKVSIDFENSTANLRDAEIRLKAARAKLSVLLGHTEVELSWPWKEKLEKGNLSFKWSIEKLSQRPDWKSAEAQLKGAEAQVSQSFGKIFPSVDLGVSYGYSKLEPLGGEGDYWAGKLSITIPLFDRLSSFSDYRVQVQNKMGTEFQLEQIRRTAKQEWEAATTSLSTAIETAKTRDKTLGVARNLYQDNLKRFQKGLTNANDLIVDQTRVSNAELFAIKGWANAHLIFMEACHAEGNQLVQCSL